MPSDPIISLSGIRGILGSSLTPENILKFSSAFTQYIRSVPPRSAGGRPPGGQGNRIVIGRDGRLYGDLIADMVVSNLSLNGCEVIDLDIVPTPTVCLAVKRFKARGGISITASHNQQEWNGMKFISKDGIFIFPPLKVEFSKSRFGGRARGMTASIDKIKQIQYYPQFSHYHISRVLNSKFVNASLIRRRKFRVVVDCVNSSGSFVIPDLLKKLGCTVITTDCDASGVFTRNPEPLPVNIKKTCALVWKNKADIGIVVDPDADRLVLITEKGIPFGEENTILTAIRHVFKHIPKNKRIAVVNLSSTRAVDDIVRELGGKLYKSPVGELNVIKKMNRVKAIIGGEGSGGVILPEVNFCRDSLVGIGLILSELAEFGMPISAYRKQLPEYFILKDKIELNHSPLKKGDKGGCSPAELINKISRKYKKYKQNRQDGLRIDFRDSWINFRKSNTEPIVRIIAEGKSGKLAKDLLNKFQNEI